MRGRIPGYILCDLDGTLIDTTILHLRAFQHTFSRHLGKTISDEQILARLGMPLKEHLACFSPQRSVQMYETFLSYYFAHQATSISLYDGFLEVLERLAADRYVLGIVSSKERTVGEAEVRARGLDRFMRVALYREDVARHKPEPDGILAAVDQLQAERHLTLMVGDAPSDILAAKLAGVKSAAALWGTHDQAQLIGVHPDYVLKKPVELLTVLPLPEVQV